MLRNLDLDSSWLLRQTPRLIFFNHENFCFRKSELSGLESRVFKSPVNEPFFVHIEKQYLNQIVHFVERLSI
jgi:hypothetical protein